MLSIQARIKTPAAVSPNYLLGACLRHAFCFVIVNVLQQMRIANRNKDVSYLAFAVLRKIGVVFRANSGIIST